MDGQTPDHGHPISSTCEPNGSGELKMGSLMILHYTYKVVPHICFHIPGDNISVCHHSLSHMCTVGHRLPADRPNQILVGSSQASLDHHL